MKKYQHIFFDLDETLWDFKRNSLETLHDVFEMHELHRHGIEKETFIRRYHHHNDIFWEKYRKGQITRIELRTDRWKITLNEFQIDDETLTQNLSENYLAILPTKKHLLEDAEEVLTYLKTKYSLHIITNGFEEVQLQKIETSGIGKFFNYIITSERAGSQKPNREIFLFAMQLTNATLSNSLFIGDSIEADINGAKAVGMDHIFFNPLMLARHEQVQSEIKGLKELMKML